MSGDFLFGVAVGLLVGGTLGALVMAVLAAASAADAHIGRMERTKDGEHEA